MVLIGSDTIPISCLASAPFLHFFFGTADFARCSLLEAKKNYGLLIGICLFLSDRDKGNGTKNKKCSEFKGGGDHSA